MRLQEVDAILEGLNAALTAALPTALPNSNSATSAKTHLLARTDAGVLLLGMSMGGATAAAAALRDGRRTQPRFAHLFLLDPWLDQAGVSPLDATDLAQPLAAGLRTCTIWLDEASQVYEGSRGPAQALIEKARAAGAAAAEIVSVPHAGHYAQTDIPSVFEHGPLRCVYLLIKGKSQNVNTAPAAQEALRDCGGKMLDVLLKDSWVTGA